MAYFSRAFELPGSTAVQSVRCDLPDRRMSCSLVRQPPRNGQASGHNFAAAPRRHREALRGAELQRRWRAVCVLSRKGFLDEASVAELADRLGVGPRHLLRLFLRHTGAPPSEIAATRRVQAAKRLIDQTTMGLFRHSLRRRVSQRAAVQRRIPSDIWPSALVVSRGGPAMSARQIELSLFYDKMRRDRGLFSAGERQRVTGRRYRYGDPNSPSRFFPAW
jgi:AraC-like DNA-binding protein